MDLSMPSANCGDCLLWVLVPFVCWLRVCFAWETCKSGKGCALRLLTGDCVSVLVATLECTVVTWIFGFSLVVCTADSIEGCHRSPWRTSPSLWFDAPEHRQRQDPPCRWEAILNSQLSAHVTLVASLNFAQKKHLEQSRIKLPTIKISVRESVCVKQTEAITDLPPAYTLWFRVSHTHRSLLFPSSNLSIYLSIYRSIYLSTYLSIYLSLSLFLSLSFF